MKKWIIALSLVMLLPFSAFALQALNEDDMNAISGQAGVSIAIDDVIIYQHIASRSYTDADGTSRLGGPADTAGTVSISDFTGMLYINAITSLDDDGKPYSPGSPVRGDYDAGLDAGFSFANTGPAFLASPLTIDVGKLEVLSAGLVNNVPILIGLGLLPAEAAGEDTYAGVRIGLPTVEVFRSEQSFDVTVHRAGAFNDGASYGTISIGESTMAVLGGFVEIAPH